MKVFILAVSTTAIISFANTDQIYMLLGITLPYFLEGV